MCVVEHLQRLGIRGVRPVSPSNLLLGLRPKSPPKFAAWRPRPVRHQFADDLESFICPAAPGRRPETHPFQPWRPHGQDIGLRHPGLQGVLESPGPYFPSRRDLTSGDRHWPGRSGSAFGMIPPAEAQPKRCQCPAGKGLLEGSEAAAQLRTETVTFGRGAADGLLVVIANVGVGRHASLDGAFLGGLPMGSVPVPGQVFKCLWAGDEHSLDWHSREFVSKERAELVIRTLEREPPRSAQQHAVRRQRQADPLAESFATEMAALAESLESTHIGGRVQGCHSCLFEPETVIAELPLSPVHPPREGEKPTAIGTRLLDKSLRYRHHNHFEPGGAGPLIRDESCLSEHRRRSGGQIPRESTVSSSVLRCRQVSRDPLRSHDLQRRGDGGDHRHRQNARVEPGPIRRGPFDPCRRSSADPAPAVARLARGNSRTSREPVSTPATGLR